MSASGGFLWAPWSSGSSPYQKFLGPPPPEGIPGKPFGFWIIIIMRIVHEVHKHTLIKNTINVKKIKSVVEQNVIISAMPVGHWPALDH